MQFTRAPRYSIHLAGSIFLVFFNSYAFVFGQAFGGLAPSIKWQQINTDSCRIIFPRYLDAQAQRIANAVSYMHQIGFADVGDQAFKIDIVLNNQSTIANGSVGIAPWKSHFLTTPPQNSFSLSALPWLDLLAIHEYRHVIQLSTARRGITKVLYWLFGQETWAGASGLAIPDWFTEGDAVWAETVLTPQGRGRTSNFLKGYRALAFENKLYNYAKARNGSIKDFVPDHYRLGYLMLQYGHRHYGAEFWKKTLADAGAYKGIFYPFSKSMRAQSNMNTSQFYQAMLSEKSKEWLGDQGETPVEFLVPSQPPKVFTNLTYPIALDDDELLYYEISFDKIGRFYLHDLQSDQRTILVAKGRSIESYHSYNQGLLCWTEFSPHPRWIARDYNDIVIYDLEVKQKRRVTKKGKYFSPHPNQQGSKIVAVHQDETLQNSLKIIDVKTGAVIHSLSNPEGLVYTYPKWLDDDHVISSVRNTLGEMAIIKINIPDEEIDTIQPFANVMIGAPSVEDEWIVYSATTAGAENVFLQNANSGDRVQVTSEPNGAFNPFLRKDALYYSVFTSKGHHLKKISIQDQFDKMKDQRGQDFSLSYEHNFISEAPSLTYPTMPYRAAAHLLNVHTWGFDFEDPVITFRALSTNVLNNLEASAGIDYNYDLERFAPFIRVTYAGLFPQFTVQGNTYSREAVIADTTRNWRETNLSGFISADLNFSSGMYQRSLVPLIGLNQTETSGDLDFSLLSALARITFLNRRLQARKNLFTRNGQYLQLRYSESLNRLQAQQMQVRSALALPGIGINHNLILHADYKADLEDADFQFTTGFSHRGYGVVPGDKLWRLSANYHFPLWYPDWGFAGLFYIYRIRSTFFYEYTSAQVEEELANRSSAGVEVVLDLNLVNATSATIGIRYAHPLSGELNAGQFELFIPAYRF